MTRTKTTPTTNDGHGRREHQSRPIRSYATHTPKWQRFQNLTTAQSTSTSTSQGNSNIKSSTSVESSEKKVVPYQRQYSHVYTHRLGALKDRCWKALNRLQLQNSNADGSYKSVDRILELKEDRLSMVVGTIIVESSTDGNSDDNYYDDDDEMVKEDRQLHPDAICRSSDQLFLEDESGRVAIRFVEVDGKSNSNSNAKHRKRKSKLNHAYQYCTGVVVGVRGVVDDKGMMHVSNIVNPAMIPPIHSSSGSKVCGSGDESDNDNESTTTTSPHLLLVSSLLCGDPEVSSLPREMLVSYLQGHFSNDNDDKAASVARVIVAGSGPGAVDPAMGLREFDLWGLQVTRTAGIPMDIMPSATDPTTRNWPQRPLHSSLLPHTLRRAADSGDANGNYNNNNSHNSNANTTNTPMARTTPNPYEALVGKQLVLGTDGLNVRDLQKYILKSPSPSTATASGANVDEKKKENEDSSMLQHQQPSLLPSLSPQPLTELEALEQTLRWAHLCPTAPNSSAIGMVPSGDPMVMSRTTASNLYFCGNCEEGFATKTIVYNNDNNDGDKDVTMAGTTQLGVPKTRLICVPKFSETGEAVLVNLKTLDAEVLRFKAGTDNEK
mmetsp:Transcript_28420/g.59783  ORF Transcript_28420/g.59783 Transcript_28420/m.59783 type:complete len:608 (-) Transcript_28420:45-1868(-)